MTAQLERGEATSAPSDAGRILRPIWNSSARTGVLVAIGVVAIFGTAIAGPFGLIALAGVLLVLGAIVHPPVAAFAMLGLAPFVIGFQRGELVPFMRPNEALLIVMWGAVALGWIIRSERPPLALNTVDVWFLVLAISGSVVPLLIAIGRLSEVGFDSVLYSVTLWKLFALYYLVRLTIRTPQHVNQALWVGLATASIVGVLAMLDGLNVAGTADRLNDYFPVEEGPIDDGRGSATIGNAIGLGVYSVFGFLVGLAKFVRGERHRLLLAAGLVGTMLGVFGSGQVTAVLALGFGGIALGFATRRMRYLATLAIPTLVVVGLLASPLIMRRINDLEPALTSTELKQIDELPGQLQPAEKKRQNPGSSWDVRVYNLEHYFLPEFDEPINVLVGVDPQPRARADEAYREYVWIESGYVWLLWIGGVPFVMAFVGFVGHAGRATFRIARARLDSVGTAASVGFASTVILAVVMTLDPHLTLRGTADLFFPILALSLVGSHGRPLIAEPAR